MSKNINLSPKHGVNPTIPICFWCGKEKNEIALLGRIGGKKDLEAPKHAILDFEPCEECSKNMDKGITVMEATSEPNEACEVPYQNNNTYPTRRYVVLTKESAQRIFINDLGIKIDFDKHSKFFLDKSIFEKIFENIINKDGEDNG